MGRIIYVKNNVMHDCLKEMRFGIYMFPKIEITKNNNITKCHGTVM